MIRYPDKEAGQVPMAYVVRKDGSSLSESQVMDFVAGQVSSVAAFELDLWLLVLNSTFCFSGLHITGGSLQEDSKTCIYLIHT